MSVVLKKWFNGDQVPLSHAYSEVNTLISDHQYPLTCIDGTIVILSLS